MLWTAFMLGLAGSLHCAGMCGPLALALPHPGGGATGFVVSRLAYNSGRLVTYLAMGAVFGLLGRSLALVGVQRWLSIGAGSAMLLGLLFASRLGARTPVVVVVDRLKATFGRLLQRRTLPSLALLGLLNGLLPCGLVYAAAAGAAATGGLLYAVGYMGLFGLGTLPLMLGIGLSGRAFPVGWRFRLQAWVPVSLALVAMLLILRGLSLGIPYVSPNLAAADPACCHH